MVKLSTRPEKRVGADALWDHAEAAMSAVLEQIAARSGGKIKTGINPGEGAFYGPKFEYVLRDAIGRDWQCGTIQVDFNLPERFGAFYIDADGEKKTPGHDPSRHVRLHGALHRHPAGEHRRAPAAVAGAGAGEGVHHRVGCRRLRRGGAGRAARRRACAPRSTSATRRSTTRCASTRWPRCRCMLVVGKREAEEKTVSVRRLGRPAAAGACRWRGGRRAGRRRPCRRILRAAQSPARAA